MLLAHHPASSFNAPVSLQEELGCSPTLSFIFRRNAEGQPFYFDPLGLSTDDNFARMREAELKHGECCKGMIFEQTMITVETDMSDTLPPAYVIKGRIAMIAVVSSLGKTILREDEFGIPFLLAKKTPSISTLLGEWTAIGAIAFILACGVLDLLLLVQGSPRDMPGDYGVGYFGVRDKGKNERSLICELENGRLAMMVMLYYLANDLHWVQELTSTVPTVMKALASKLSS